MAWVEPRRLRRRFALLAVVQAMAFVMLPGLLEFALLDALLLVGVAARARAAWWLLVAVNAWPLIAAAGQLVSSGPWTWAGNLLVLLALCGASEAILCSPAMRRHVRRDDGTRRPVATIAP